MDLDIYEYLLGKKVTDCIAAKAAIRRSRTILEALLGFTLSPDNRLENLYYEVGKGADCSSCPNEESLFEPDEVIFAYRLFPYNEHDKYFHVDPFTDVARIKLVKDNVTVKELTACKTRPQWRQGWAKFIERCPDCWCEDKCCNHCFQLAVDANWIGACEETSCIDPCSDYSSVLPCLPEDLLYVWATAAQKIENGECSSDIKSESIGSHSYTRFDRTDNGSTGLNLSEVELNILRKYAGPHGSLNKVIVP